MTPLESSLFDTIMGLPVHPLAVHLAVVLLPLSALWLVVLILVRPLRPRWATATVLGVAVGTGATFVAKESGEALAARVGEPQLHAFWGDIVPWVGVGLTVLAVIWWILQRRDVGKTTPGAATAGVGLVTALVALVATAGVGLVGHSGAEAVWADRINPEPAASASPSPSATPIASEATPTASETTTTTTTTSAPVTPTTPAGLTMADVAQHNTATDCWTAISGNVYDLTQWVGAHPGGRPVIEAICGKDGTAAFTGEHGSKRLPNETLANYKKGALAG